MKTDAGSESAFEALADGPGLDMSNATMVHPLTTIFRTRTESTCGNRCLRSHRQVPFDIPGGSHQMQPSTPISRARRHFFIVSQRRASAVGFSGEKALEKSRGGIMRCLDTLNLQKQCV
jgi:hypothetical protein